MEKNAFDSRKLSRLIGKISRGKPRIDAYEEAIRLADAVRVFYGRLDSRFNHVRAVHFQADPPKCIGVAAEFAHL